MWYPPCNWVLWSLGVEIWFSLLFPLLVLLWNRFGAFRFYAFCAVIALSTRYGVVILGEGFRFEMLDPVRDSLAGRLDDFAAGMVVASLYANGRKIAGTRSRGVGATYAIVCLLLFQSAFSIWDGFHAKPGKPIELLIPLANTSFHVAASMLLLGCLRAPETFLARLLSIHLLRWLGKMCFSIYVWHGIAMLTLLNSEPYAEDGYTKVTTIGPYTRDVVFRYLPLVFALSYLSFRHIEQARAE